MKILCIGHITYDITFPIEFYPKENSKYLIETKEEGVGGPASIAAILLSKWGEDVKMIGTISNDEFGRKIKNQFLKNNVNIDDLVISKNSTAQSFILASKNGSRTIYIYEPKNDKIKPFDIDYNPDIILIDGYEPEISLYFLEKYKNAISIMDAGRYTHDMYTLAKKVNYLVCSKEFAEDYTGLKIQYEDNQSIKNVYNKMKEKFNNNIIITLETNGSLYEEDNKIKRIRALKVKTVDSTGAGDIYHGAFTYAIAKNYDLEHAIKFATIAAALSVTKLGNYNAIPSLEEMWSVYSEVK